LISSAIFLRGSYTATKRKVKLNVSKHKQQLNIYITFTFISTKKARSVGTFVSGRVSKSKVITPKELCMRATLISTVAVVLGLPGLTFACSGLAVVKDGRVLLGGNNDTAYTDHLKLRATPGRDGQYGRVCISQDVVPEWSPFGAFCMNQAGLAVTHANTPAGGLPHDPDKPQIRHNFIEKVIAEAATVKQAVALVRAYTFPPEFEAGMHMMLADSSGDAAVIEWAGGEMKVIPRQGPTLFMTNSLLSGPNTAGGPNSRYNRGSKMLPVLKDASADSVFSVLKEISVGAVLRGQEVGTLDSGVWDVTRGELHLVFKRDFDHPRIFKLSEELAKGEHSVDLTALFPNPVPFETAWRDENGPVVRKAAP
jgi:hypothetical protein